MSNVNYSLKHKGVRLISADEAWKKGKNGKQRLNPKFHFVGKIDTKLPNWEFNDTDKAIVRHRIKEYKKSTNRKPKWWFVKKRKWNKKKK